MSIHSAFVMALVFKIAGQNYKFPCELWCHLPANISMRLSMFTGDVILMDPKLSKLVKNAVKDGKTKHEKKKAKATAHGNFL